jgi:hypothetical protein
VGIPPHSEGDQVKAAKQTSGQYLKLGLAGLAFLFLIGPTQLHAQGCAMCYQSAAASGARLIHALKNGIVVLMIPPLLMTGVFARLVYRKRNLCNEEFVDHREV